MPGIGVISNPRSGINRRRPQLAGRLAYILGEKGQLQEPDDVDGLVEVARDFRKHDIDILCINGGDGTAHRVLSAFVQVYGQAPLPKVALLRGGTINNVARSIGMPRGRPETLLGRLVSRYHADEDLLTVERNLLVVDGVHAGFLFGNGLIASFMEAYYEGGTVGSWKAIRVLSRTIGSAMVGGPFIRHMLRPVRAEVMLDGHRWPLGSFLSIGISTIPHMGLGFRPFHEIDRHPDRLQAIGWGCSVRGVVASLPYYYFKKPSPRHDVLTGIPRRLVMRSEEPLNFQLDGDFHRGGTEMVVTVGPRVSLVAG